MLKSDTIQKPQWKQQFALSPLRHNEWKRYSQCKPILRAQMIYWEMSGRMYWGRSTYNLWLKQSMHSLYEYLVHSKVWSHSIQNLLTTWKRPKIGVNGETDVRASHVGFWGFIKLVQPKIRGRGSWRDLRYASQFSPRPNLATATDSRGCAGCATLLRHSWEWRKTNL